MAPPAEGKEEVSDSNLVFENQLENILLRVSEECGEVSNEEKTQFWMPINRHSWYYLAVLSRGALKNS